MVEINGKEYKINMNMKLGTQKLLKKIQDDPQNLDNLKYLEIILRDVIRPVPTAKELFNFRNSDVEKIFEAFGEDAEETHKDFKKKRSIL